MIDLNAIESRLRTRLTSLKARVEGIDEELAEPPDDDFTEQASEAASDDVMKRVGIAAEGEIRQIQNALQRIAEGEYGNCKSCGCKIPSARLEALPYATRCVRCAD